MMCSPQLGPHPMSVCLWGWPSHESWDCLLSGSTTLSCLEFISSSRLAPLARSLLPTDCPLDTYSIIILCVFKQHAYSANAGSESSSWRIVYPQDTLEKYMKRIRLCSKCKCSFRSFGQFLPMVLHSKSCTWVLESQSYGPNFHVVFNHFTEKGKSLLTNTCSP
jgi:hypothetical protein